MDDQAFRAYYEYDDDDLYLNRQGRLSDRQYKAIARLEVDTRRYSRLGATAALVAAALVPCLVLPLSLLSLFTKDWTTTLLAWGGCLVWLVIFGGAGLVLLRSARAPAPADWRVTTVSGPVVLQREQRQSSGRYSRSYTVTSLTLGQASFELDDSLVGHVRDGDNLAVYCADGEIVSVEQLPSPAL